MFHCMDLPFSTNPLLMVIWFVSSLLLLQITLQRIILCISYFVFWGQYLELRFLGQGVNVYMFLLEIIKSPLIGSVYHFTFSLAICALPAPYSLPTQ